MDSSKSKDLGLAYAVKKRNKTKSVQPKEMPVEKSGAEKIGDSVVDAIMKKRNPMAEGGMVMEEDKDPENVFAEKMDFGTHPSEEDEPFMEDLNDSVEDSDDDDSLVGQIIKKRGKK